MALPNALAEAEELRTAVGAFVRRAREHDTLPVPQATALGHLLRDGPHSIVALAELDRIRHQSMARTVRLLAECGLVEVRPDADDRRRVVVTITEAGRTALEAERSNRASWIAHRIETTLSRQERGALRQVVGILDKLTSVD